MALTPKDLVIGFDMDGVILDNSRNKIALAEKFGFSLKLEDTPSERFHFVVPEVILNQMRPLLYDDPEMALKAETIRGAIDGLNKVREAGISYFLISRRRNWSMAVRSLEHHDLWPKFFNQQNAFFVFEPEDKDERAKALGVNLYIDDQPTVLEKLISVENRILFDQFNLFGKPSFPHKKVSSWEELLPHLL
ncbi:MAG: hypothetical protein AAB345_02405 [Patescibacteria group bacterium]